MSQSLEERVIKLISLVEKREFLEAIQYFYADDAVMQENGGPPRTGLEAILAGERNALASFKKMHVSHAESFIVDGDRAAINWLFEYTDAGGRRRRLNEIAYRQWRAGKIVYEQFYYDPAQKLAEVDPTQHPAVEPVAAA